MTTGEPLRVFPLKQDDAEADTTGWLLRGGTGIGLYRAGMQGPWLAHSATDN